MGIIYFIKCKDTGEVYIGSTKQKLYKRIWNHKNIFNCSSQQIIKRGNYFYDTLEVVEDDKDILIRENYYIKTMKNCINRNIPYRTPEEKKELNCLRVKKWSSKNIQELKLRKKKYREEHNKEISEYNKQLYQYKCSWGSLGDNNLLKIDINLFHDR